MHRKKYLLARFVVALFVVCLASHPAWASLGSGSGSLLSGTSNIAQSQSTSLSIQWSMVRSSVTAPPGATVKSLQGEFTDVGGSLVLGTVAKSLTKTKPASTASVTFQFNEILRVPRDVLFKANKLGLTQIRYRRSFTDCPAAECSALSPLPAVTLNITGSSGGAFGISRFELRFYDETLAALVELDESLVATAKLQATRSGIVKGVWEIATPATTSGQPSFRTLRLVRQQVSSGITQIIRSPKLPTHQYGMHLVRFRLTEPRIESPAPHLQYVVLQPTVSRPEAIQPEVIDTHSPLPYTQWTPETRFAWAGMSGVVAYKLEIAKRESPGQRVTGMMVKSDTTDMTLSSLVRARLSTGAYQWRIIAIGPAGQTLGLSDWSSIEVP